MNGINVSDAALAADFATLLRLLRSVSTQLLTIGPDADLMGDFKEVLRGQPTINVSTFHLSLFLEQCTIVDLLSPHAVIEIRAKLGEFAPTHRELAPTTALWVGEGATDEAGGNGGGRPGGNCTGLRFAAAFTYLELLGAAAQAGVAVFMRHTLDTMFDSNDWTPGPVYWVALLWKQTMGTSVLNASTSDPAVIAFAHSSAAESSKIAVAVVNLNSHPVLLSDPEVAGSGRQACTWRRKWALTAAAGLNGSSVMLNDKPLTVSADGELPSLAPNKYRCADDAGAVLPARSLNFLVYDEEVVPSDRADPNGARAVALQQQVNAACEQNATTGAVLVLEPVEYNFSTYNLLLESCSNITLIGKGPAATTLLFKPDTGQEIDPGVNATNCRNCQLLRMSIDYDPKPKTCTCYSRKTSGPPTPWRPVPSPGCPPAAKGITLHFQNCSNMLVEDVTIHAAPFMAVTSFNGEGGHVLRRLRFERNQPGQIWVAGKDAVHESDVRRGITLEECVLSYVNDVRTRSQAPVFFACMHYATSVEPIL